MVQLGDKGRSTAAAAAAQQWWVPLGSGSAGQTAHLLYLRQSKLGPPTGTRGVAWLREGVGGCVVSELCGWSVGKAWRGRQRTCCTMPSKSGVQKASARHLACVTLI